MREKKTFCYRGERERRGWGVRMPDKEIYKNDMEALFYGVKLLNFSGLSLVLKKGDIYWLTARLDTHLL